MFTVHNVLPRPYDDNNIFMVTGYKHDISSQGWYTELDGTMIASIPKNIIQIQEALNAERGADRAAEAAWRADESRTFARSSGQREDDLNAGAPLTAHERGQVEFRLNHLEETGNDLGDVMLGSFNLTAAYHSQLAAAEGSS